MYGSRVGGLAFHLVHWALDEVLAERRVGNASVPGDCHSSYEVPDNRYCLGGTPENNETKSAVARLNETKQQRDSMHGDQNHGDHQAIPVERHPERSR